MGGDAMSFVISLQKEAGCSSMVEYLQQMRIEDFLKALWHIADGNGAWNSRNQLRYQFPVSQPNTVLMSRASGTVTSAGTGTSTSSGSADSSALVIVPNEGTSAQNVAVLTDVEDSGPVVHKRAATLPSKYDGKGDITSWISSMCSYFEVLRTPQEDRSMIMGTNTEPAVRSFIELQAVTAGYERIDLTEWLKVTPVRTLEDLLIAQYQDKHVALKARLKLEALKGQTWRTSMQALEQHVTGLFTTPNLGWTDVSCMDVVMGVAPKEYVSRLGLKAHTTWRELPMDLVNLEAKDLARRAKAPAAGRKPRNASELLSSAGKQAKGVEESSTLSTTGEAEPSVAGPSKEPESDQQPALEARTDAESKVVAVQVLYIEPWEETKEVDFHSHVEHWLQLKQQRRVQGSVELTFFKLLMNCRYIRVLIDSGSTTNFFSPNGIREAGLGMKQVELQNPCQTHVGNQEVVTSTHVVKGVRITFDKDRTVTHEQNFYVLDKCPFDVVIGLGWLRAVRKEAVIAAMNKRQHAMIKHANKSRKEANFKLGSYVWVKMSEFSDEEGVSRKLLPLYYGPWQVLKEEQATKRKLEEEMERLNLEEEEKMTAVEEKEIEEENEEVPLIRRSPRDKGESSGMKREESWLEKKVSEWVANLSLGEEEEAMLYVPPEEKEAVIRELEAEEDPLRRQTIEEEKKLQWKLCLTRAKKRRMDEASKMAKELEVIKEQREQIQAQTTRREEREREGVLFESVRRGKRSVRPNVRSERTPLERSTDTPSSGMANITSAQWQAMLDAADESERPFFQKQYDDAIQREREAEAAARAANIADQVALLRIPEANADRFQEGLAAAVAALVRLRTLENLQSRVAALKQQNQELQVEITSLKQSQLFAPRPPNPRSAVIPVSQSNTVLVPRASGTVASAGTGASSSSGNAGSSALVTVPNTGTSAQNATVFTGVQYSGPMVDKRAATLPSKYDGKADVTSWISSMRSYFEVMQTPQEDRSMIMGTNTEPTVRNYIELQVVVAGYERIDLTEWLKITPFMGVAPKEYLSLLALKDHTTWRELMTDLVNLEAKDLARRKKAPAAGGKPQRNLFGRSNQLALHDHREAKDQSYADDLTLDDDQEPDFDMGCSSSAIESDVNEDEKLNAFRKTASNKGPNHGSGEAKGYRRRASGKDEGSGGGDEEKEKVAEGEVAVEEEAAAEEEKERMRIESGEGSSGGTMKRDVDANIEKKISEWVANLSLGEDEAAESYVTEDEKAALTAELAAMTDPMERREREDEQKLQWKLRMKREKRRRREEVNKMTAVVAKVQKCRAEVLAQPDDKAKWDKVLGYLEVLSKAWMEERQAIWSQDVALSAMRSGFRDFAREIVTHIGGEVKQWRDNVGKFCEGAIEGAKAIATVDGETRPRKEPVKLKFPDAYGGKKEENFDNWEASVNSCIYLQHILIEEQVLVAFQALKDEAASFARSLARAAGCENNLVAYSKVTPLSQFLKLLKERFADPTRGVRASDKLQTIHSRQWRSANALKGTMDDLVAALRGHFFDKSQQAGITYDALSREVVLYESKSMPVTTFWHKDLEKGKKWKDRTISGQVKAKDHLILTLEEGGTDEVPYDQIEWGLGEEDSSVGQGRSYAAVAAGGRPQGRGGGQGQRGQAMGGRGSGAQGVGGQGNRQAGGGGQGPPPNRQGNRSPQRRGGRAPQGGWHPGLPQGRPWEDLGLDQQLWQERVNMDGIKPEDSKIAAIRDWPTPRTLTELRSFLGLANYYRKFVRNFSTIAAPLLRLLKKEAIWQWDKDCTSTLKKLKRALIEYPVLKVADSSLPFVVTTDASQYGIGAVLQQDDGNGYRPVEFMSTRMPCEKVATSTYERELYALRQALDHWKHYLLGRHFKVYSNHETLRWLKTQSKMTPKLTRWAVEIDQFDFELKPVKGKYNVVADALSRRSYYFGAVVHYLDIGRDLQEKVRQAYAQDPIYSDLLKRVREAPETEPDYRTSDGLLFEKTNVFDRVCVPNREVIRSLILGECHNTEVHFGWQKTLANLMRAYTWSGMKNDYIEYVRSCKVCQRNKSTTRAPLGLLRPLPILDQPGDSVSIDFMDTQVKGRHGKSQVMVVVDSFSKYAVFVPLPAEARTDLVIQKSFDFWVSENGIPLSIVIDRELMRVYGSKLQMSSGRHPETNGQTEQMNKILQQVLRMYIRPDQINWDEMLPKKSGETDEAYQARMLAWSTETKRRADDVATAAKKKAEDAEKARLLAIEQQRQQDEAATRAANEERIQRREKIFGRERALLTMAAEWRTEAENGKMKESENNIALLLSHLTNLLTTCIAHQEDIHNLDGMVQQHKRALDSRLQQLEQTIAAPVASSSNTSDRLEALEIDVGSLTDGVQLQHTTTQQLEQRICAAAANPSSGLRESTPKFDGQEIFCDSMKTDPIPWFRKFELTLQLHLVSEYKHHAYLYSSGDLSSSSGSSRDSVREFNMKVLDPLTSGDFAWLPLPTTGRLPGPQCATLCAHLHTYLSFYAPPTSLTDDEVAVGDILAYVTKVACEFRNQRYDDNNAPLIYVRIQVGQASFSASRNFMSQAFMQRVGLGAQVRRKASSTAIKLVDERTQQLIDRYIDAVPFADIFELPTGVVPDRPISHEIILEAGAVSSKGCIYRMSEEELTVLRAQLDDLLDKGWIRPSSSPYGAPVLFVRKKKKDLRLCIDYRKLNAQTVKNVGPLPRIDDLLERLGGTKYFSKLDLKSGYHQISIRPNDCYKSVFKTRYGHFEWVVMPFGLSNALATFQAAMTNEFRTMLDRFVLVYLDDILVYSRSLEDHLEHLRRVLETLRRAKYKANRDKCEFVQQELEYLGHFVTLEGISPLLDKIQAIQEWPEPRNVTEVCSFLGLASYYQRFIKGYSKIAAHLTKLQCEDRPFDFGEEARESFLALKVALLSAEVLRIYDPLLPTCVTTDASGYGIGAVLEQHDGKELLAFVHALKRWRHFLLGGSQFRWVTDNNLLVFYKTQDTVNSTIARWMAFIDQFDFFPGHIPGKSNRFADALSRRPDHCTVVYSTFEIDDDLRDSFIRDYLADPEFRDKYANCSSPNPAPSHYRIQEGYLLVHTRGKDLLCVPSDPHLRTRLLGEFHDAPATGHFGVNRTIGRRRERFWWPGLLGDVTRYCESCKVCGRCKSRNHRPYNELRTLPVPLRRREAIAMDIIGPFPKHKTGVDGILTVVDQLTKFTMFLPCGYHAKALELAEVSDDVLLDGYYSAGMDFQWSRDPCSKPEQLLDKELDTYLRSQLEV
ncbi:hypothetical protein CBR_g34084 [Chara braunii]|uniref:RNA-directed DNA polymerase n=1 Tax=Chara braunii TaxID=69332 RepID=A0A388LI16_CHABU|nr:hypothetical protein CBR_g34084 [Chara braunii]|eukprot:GBG81901.1 hypothetical protein CBR_g34084 [Chara braunii]